jgi:uncharacterized membrane protein (DUF2068 family)
VARLVPNDLGQGIARSDEEAAQPFGVRLVVAYKVVKAVAELLLGVLLLMLGGNDAADDLRRVLHHVSLHATEAWSIALVAHALSGITARRVEIMAWASTVDGALSAFEGWALGRGYAWSQWFIVGATSCALPFEIAALVRRVRVGRFVLLFVNIAVVVYLVWRRMSGGRIRRRDA